MSIAKHYSNFNNMPVFSNLLENFIPKELLPELFTIGRDFYSNVPSVNIIELADSFRLDVSAAGLKREDFKVQVEQDNQLIIAATKKTKEVESDKFLRKEFDYSGFKRAFTLPNTVEVERMEATYKDGILSIHIPKLMVKKEDIIKDIEIL